MATRIGSGGNNSKSIASWALKSYSSLFTEYPRSPAGIALVVIIGVAVLAGIAFGIVFAVKGGSGSTSEDELAEVWEEYTNIAAEADSGLASISYDPNALAKTQEDLKKTQKKVEALEKVLKATKVPTSNKWKVKYEQLAGTLTTYNQYVNKLNDLYGTIAQATLSNTLSAQLQTIDAMLNELKTLASEIKDLADKFLDNNAVTTKQTFEPQDIIDRITDLEAEIDKEAVASGQQPTTEPAPNQTPAEGVAGTYVSPNGGTLTLNSDGTCVAADPNIGTVSGNTITLTSANGDVDTGTIDSGGITLSTGARLTKQ